MRKDDSTDAYGRRAGRQDDGSEERRLWRRSYEKHFDGYTPETVLNRAGKETEVRVYTGTLFRQELDDEQRRIQKITYSCLLAISLLSALLALCLPVKSNRNVLAFAFGCLPAAVCIRMIFALGAYLPAGRDLKLHEYHDGASVLSRAALPAFISFALSLVASLTAIILDLDVFSPLELLRMAMLAASGAAIVVISKKERRVKYTALTKTGT